MRIISGSCVQYLEKVHVLHDDLRFLPERMKIEKFKKLVTSLHDKTEYVIHIRNLKHTLNHGLVLKKYIELLHLIKKLGLKPYIKHGSKKKKPQTVSKYISLSWWIMQFLEKM